MDFNDKPAFLDKMVEMASIVGRGLNDEDVESFFNHLKDYPIDLVKQAMDKAFYDRDQTDVFNQKTMITVPEVRVAAEEILNSGEAVMSIGCEECNQTGYTLMKRKDAQPMASPCSCLLEVRRYKKNKGKKKR